MARGVTLLWRTWSLSTGKGDLFELANRGHFGAFYPLTATGTIIAILTYRRAKATILQPIRSEVVKKQTEHLSELLKLLFENKRSFEMGFDYSAIAEVNALCLLKDYGFTDFYDDNELIAARAKRADSGHLLTHNKLENIYLIEHFGKKAILPVDQQKILERLDKGEAKVALIWITSRYKDFSAKLENYLNHPFMPTSLQETLKGIVEDASYNLKSALTIELENFINAVPKQVKANPRVIINLSGVSNNFNHTRRPHNKQTEQLINDIRNHLRIDDQWAT